MRLLTARPDLHRRRQLASARLRSLAVAFALGAALAGTGAAAAQAESSADTPPAAAAVAAYSPSAADPVPQLQPDPATLPTPPGADGEPPRSWPRLPAGHPCRQLPPHEMETCITRTHAGTDTPR